MIKDGSYKKISSKEQINIAVRQCLSYSLISKKISHKKRINSKLKSEHLITATPGPTLFQATYDFIAKTFDPVFTCVSKKVKGRQ